MAQQLSDTQLLSCPEPLEEMFIHRGRRDIIASQAGKENKNSSLQFMYKIRGERLLNILKTSNQVSCYTFQLKIGHFLSLLLVACVP